MELKFGKLATDFVYDKINELTEIGMIKISAFRKIKSDYFWEVISPPSPTIINRSIGYYCRRNDIDFTRSVPKTKDGVMSRYVIIQKNVRRNFANSK